MLQRVEFKYLRRIHSISKECKVKNPGKVQICCCLNHRNPEDNSATS